MRPSPDQAAVLDALRVVIDPDLGKDIVSLGFVTRLAIELTAPACPVKDRLKGEAEQAVTSVAGVTAVDIEMTAAVRTAALPDGARQPVAVVTSVIAVGG